MPAATPASIELEHAAQLLHHLQHQLLVLQHLQDMKTYRQARGI
jgi:hypothetical protein